MLSLDTVKSIYEASPHWLKSPVGVFPIEYVLGKKYRKQRDFLLESSGWSQEQLKNYQFDRLAKTVEYAATHSNFYKKMFINLGLKKRIETLDDFYKIPLMDKATLRKAGSDIYSSAISATDRYRVATGGTTGAPVELMMSSSAFSKEWAFVHDYLLRHGIKPNDRKVSLRGIPFSGNSEGGFFRYNPVYKEFQVSPFHLTEKNVQKIAKKITEFRPAYIHGYPSAIELFAKASKTCGLNRSLKLKGVLAISETLLESQRLLVQEVFDCPVFTFYGHTERLIFAGDSPSHTGFFPDPRYGFTELIEGELVGTGFINLATPLLRFRTGDLASVENIDRSDPRKGIFSSDKISSLNGRWKQELILGKNGAKISITALNMHSEVFSNVERFQFYQEERGTVELRVVPMARFAVEVDVPAIEKAFYEKVQDELDVIVKIVDKVELTSRDKQLFLIQKLDIK